MTRLVSRSFLTFTLAAAALAVLPACNKEPSAAPARAEASLDELRALALADAPGKDKVDEAIRGLTDKLKKDDARSDWWTALGQVWILKARKTADPGFYLSADAAAQLALRAQPGYAPASALRALVMVNQHRFADARDAARAVLRKDPESLLALGALADALLELGDVEASADAVQKMVDLKPDLGSYGRAAHLRWLHGDAETAKRYYRMAIDSGTSERTPESGAWMVVQTALVFWNEGDLDGAEAGFQHALQRMPGYPPALVGLARVELARGRARQAVPLLQEAWDKSPLVETGWLLGDALTAAGDAKAAKASYDAAIALGERSDHLSLGNLLAAKSWRIPDALKYLEGELRERPSQPVREAYAWALHRAGKHQEAKAQIEQALALGTQDPRLLFRGGAIKLAAGDEAGGKALLERALKLNPAFEMDGAREARELLAKAQGQGAGVTGVR